ncbi:MAG: STAS domain-containing protein [Rubrivivax sp.]|jgi:hypothetical protein|nr:STAS domain-containing protein [Rubrivivax sp.]
MGEPKENKSFFRKVVQFVSNPTMEWGEAPSRPSDGKSLERSELRAMVERKRRNDFVRKREFDMLRRVRREGLTAEQLAALGPSSRLDDGESRHPLSESASRSPGVVKAKIDHIEREMVGDTSFRGSKNASFFDAPTEPGVLTRRGLGSMVTPLGALPSQRDSLIDNPQHPALPPLPPLPDLDLTDLPLLREPASSPTPLGGQSAVGPTGPVPMIGNPAMAFPSKIAGLRLEIEVNEVVHDPELDEAVIAFANADFALCERSLQQLVTGSGVRAQHAETWLVLFDLYRATGQQALYDSLAIDYAERFGLSAPQWFSMPKAVAEVKAEQVANSRPMPLAAGTAGAQGAGAAPAPLSTPGASVVEVGWVAPVVLDTDAVAHLRSQTLQLPLPWVLDWTQLKQVDVEAATQLSTLFRLWAGQVLEMRWIGGERLFTALAEAAPTGVRDADPAFWQVRLDALRLANRPDQFDETAIDYCVTYEVSPPSWEPVRCSVRLTEPGQPTVAPQLSLMSEVSTTFEDSGLGEPHSKLQVAHVELSGQLVADLGDTLSQINSRLGAAPLVEVNCANLIRVDFIAAGDLLNWVLSRRGEGRQVEFSETHRLIALFFGAMGINEHARVLVRRQ